MVKYILDDYCIYIILEVKSMLISTTSSIEGKAIKEYRGVVFGEVINGVNFMRDF